MFRRNRTQGSSSRLHEATTRRPGYLTHDCSSVITPPRGTPRIAPAPYRYHGYTSNANNAVKLIVFCIFSDAASGCLRCCCGPDHLSQNTRHSQDSALLQGLISPGERGFVSDRNRCCNRKDGPAARPNASCKHTQIYSLHLHHTPGRSPRHGGLGLRR